MTDRETTIYNGSQLKLILIDEIKRMIIISRSTMNISQWLNSIKDFDMELEGVKTKNERPEIAEKIQKLESNILEVMRKPKMINGRMKIPKEIIFELDEVYKRLIQIYHDSGLEMQLEKGALGGFGK